MNTPSILLAASLALGGIAASHTANAALVEYSATVAAQTTPFSSNFSVQLFDGSLGTLGSVTLTLVSNIVGQIDLFNNLRTAQNFSNAFAQIPVTVTAGTRDASSVTSTATALLASGTAAAGPGISSFSGIASTASNSASVAPANFANYIGTSGATALFTAASTGGNFGGSSVPGLFFGGSATAGGTFKISYLYEPVAAVPLPAAAWLLGSGVLTMAAAARRKRRPN